jgi:hypothetical protein
MTKLEELASDEICVICKTNKVHIRSRGLCNACYLKARRKGLLDPVHRKKYDRIKCQMPNCTNTITKKSKTGFCKKCYRKLNNACNSDVREQQAEQRRKWHLKQYGITPEDYKRMFDEQNGVCAICSKPETNLDYRTKELRRLAVDHCHETNIVRGLLCEHCNTGIGKFYHNSELLEKAAEYLKLEIPD